MKIRCKSWFAVISLISVLDCACQSSAETALGVVSPKSKNHFIGDIISQLELTYYGDPLLRGKTLKVIIKDFTLDDEETYAIVEMVEEFWIIVLPAERKKIYGTDQELCVCRSYSLETIRKDIVDLTKKNSFVREFTVPKSISR